MNIINPIKITAAMMSSALAEDATAAWTSATYAVGDFRHVVATHRVYKCAVAGVRSISPELDPANWVDTRPTNKWAPFDVYTSTTATSTTSLSYNLVPGYFNAFALYGLVGTNYSVELKDTAGGATIWGPMTGFLVEDPIDWYEYLFNPPKVIDRLVYHDLPIRPASELVITITSGSGQPVGLGMVAIGDYQSLFGSGAWGGTNYGASAEPMTYSYIKTNDDGTTTIVRRHSATNLRATISMPQIQADAVLQVVQSVLDIPVAWIATDNLGYRGLTSFGLGSGVMTYDSFGAANLAITVKGLV